MPQTLITGATGFVGSHLARALAARGDELRLLIRRSDDGAALDDLEFERVNGDVTDRRAVRRAVAGVDRVFHCAGLTSMRRELAERVGRVNVDGTRIVCEEALDAGVVRVVHTSAAAALGPADPGGRADEAQRFSAAARGIPYVHSKHEAESAALGVAAHGLDVVIVNPTYVVGPSDPAGNSMIMLRRFLEGEIPAYVNGGINICDVRDVADGMLLADQAGGAGERYILGGRNFTLQRLFADLARVSGLPAPAVRLPAPVLLAGAEVVERLGLPVAVSAEEARASSLWWTYSAAKAKRELGFSPRPHEETLSDAVNWLIADLGISTDRELGLGEQALGAVAAAARAAGKLLP